MFSPRIDVNNYGRKKAPYLSSISMVGSDDIHYQILKHIPECTLKTLLNIYNKIWDGGDFPTDWREATCTIIPIPKPGKDTTNPTTIIR